METAVKLRFAVVFLMLLSLGVCLGLPAEDVLDASFDESEALPYETTPLFSIVVPQRAKLSRYSLHFHPVLKSCGRYHETSVRVPSIPDSFTVIIQPLTLRC